MEIIHNREKSAFGKKFQITLLKNVASPMLKPYKIIISCITTISFSRCCIGFLKLSFVQPERKLKIMFHFASARFFASICFCLIPLPAFAYTDPGTGMLLIQGFVAAIAVIIAFVKNPIKTVKLWLSFYSNEKKEDPTLTNTEEKITKNKEDKDARP